jgi:glutamate synthase domain-containing protein 2
MNDPRSASPPSPHMPRSTGSVHGALRGLGGTPLRYSAFALCIVLCAVFVELAIARNSVTAWILAAVFGALFLVGVRDLLQVRHAILRNYPVIGHLRFLLEYIRPELRQYFFENDTETLPFSRAQRSLVYQRAKGEPDNRPFGTQLDTGARGYEWINHSMAPTHLASHDFRVWIGGVPGGAPSKSAEPATQPYSASVFNISAMSFGSLSGNAILALNKGAKLGGFAHDTGEGSISKYHRENGGDLTWQVASGYFGCRNPDGTFSEEKFATNSQEAQVKLIEIKLSQGAKPGHGGILPGTKVTQEIADARGVPVGVDCISPSAHSAFHTPIELMHFIVRLRKLSGGKPVGFKFCLGHPWEWFAIVKAMLETNITPDFIVVDGAEGGTGAAPVEFTDHVGAPVQEGLSLVHNTLIGVNLRDRISIGCAGKVISAFDLARYMALGADYCNAGRGFMFALGCIQAQTCHTGNCPTGVTTQDASRQQALVVPDKAERVAMFHKSTLHGLMELVQAAGLEHPQDITAHHIVRRVTDTEVRLLANLVMRMQPGALLHDDVSKQHTVFAHYWPLANPHSFSALQTPPLAPSAGSMADTTAMEN